MHHLFNVENRNSGARGAYLKHLVNLKVHILRSNLILFATEANRCNDIIFFLEFL